MLIRERTAIRAPLLERLPRLRLISQRSVYPHIDIDACTRLGIVVSSDLHAGSPSYATAELTWGLVLAAMRADPAADGVAASRALAGGGRPHAHGQDARHLRLRSHRTGRGGLRRRRSGWTSQAWASEASRARAAADGVHVPAVSKEEFFATQRRRLAAPAAGRRDARHRHRAPTSPTCSRRRCSSTRAAPGSSSRVRSSTRCGPAGRAWPQSTCSTRTAARSSTIRCSRLHNVVCTPHIGYVTREEWELQFADVFDQINAYAAGSPINVVNPDVLG